MHESWRIQLSVFFLSISVADFFIILSCVSVVVVPSSPELTPTPSRSRLPVTLPSSSRRSTGGAAVVADQGAPGVPAHLEGAHLSARYVTLAWSAPEQPGASPIIGYTVYWKEFSSDRLVCQKVNKLVSK